MNELALFAGAGGGILGGKLLGWRTVCAVEIEPHPASVLIQRQNDGILSPFPVWDDVRTFNGKPWRGIVDVVSGGFPCQDITPAGRGDGINGEQSGLWKEMARIISEVRPCYVFVENSAILNIRGIGTVLADLSALGFDAEWGVISAKDVGAWHLRERTWIVAADPDQTGFEISSRSQALTKRDWNRTLKCHPGWPPEPGVGRVVHGVGVGVDRIKALGNGQVPRVAALAWRVLHKRLLIS